MTEKCIKMVQPSKQNQQHQIVGFHYIRAIAYIAIVLLHVTYAASLQYRNSISTQAYTITSMITNLMMWAVPCFIMVTGALLLNPNHEVTLAKIYRKYMKKVFIALIAFVFVYCFFDMIVAGEGVSLNGFMKGFVQFFTGTSWSPLWYLYILIGLYALLPLYSRITQAATYKELQYGIIVGFIVLSLFPLTALFNIKLNFTIHITSIYPFYLFLGYALYNDIIKNNKKTNIIIFIVSIVLIIGVVYYRWMHNVETFNLLLSYASPLNILLSASLFHFFKSIKPISIKGLHKALIALDQASFGIYLIHIIFVKYFLAILHYNPYKVPVLGFIGIVCLISILSWIISYVWNLCMHRYAK